MDDHRRATVARARAAGLALDDEPHVNPGTQTREIALRDLDGYQVMISEA